MIVCHSIAVSDELKFLKHYTKLLHISPKDEEDAQLHNNLSILNGKNFSEVRQLCMSKTMRNSFNSSLALSIETRREIVAFDLVEFAAELSISMTITERQVQLLIKFEMYSLI